MEISLIGKASAIGTDEYRFESYISNINKLNINYLYNRLNSRNIYKYSFILMKYTKYILLLLKKFKYEGIISSFTQFNYLLFKVYFNYPGCLTVFRNIKFTFKNKTRYSISFKAMGYFLRNNYTILYFSTSHGILSSEEIWRYRCGGFVICAIM